MIKIGEKNMDKLLGGIEYALYKVLMKIYHYIND